MDVDRRLAKAELPQVIDDDAGHDPVLVMRRNRHSVERSIFAKNLIHGLLQQKDIGAVPDDRGDQRRADENESFAVQMGNRNRDALELQLSLQPRAE